MKSCIYSDGRLLRIGGDSRVRYCYCQDYLLPVLSMAADLWGEGGEEAFGSTEAYAWLTANAYKFGFIERFPEGKEKVTGSPAEPSHWRFVGQYHAAAMHESGLCLEEYISSLGGPG